MKKQNIVMLGLGYAAGLLVALKFGKKGGKKDFETLKNDIKEAHINLWSKTEEIIFSPENKAKVIEMKEKALAEIEEFADKAEVEMRKMADK